MLSKWSCSRSRSLLLMSFRLMSAFISPRTRSLTLVRRSTSDCRTSVSTSASPAIRN